jgi:copper homeostasis protein
MTTALQFILANEEVSLCYGTSPSLNFEMSFLEIACFNVQSGIIAAQNGASRIELCKDADLGGTTPLLSDFQALKSQLSKPIHVMIRPRGGNFVYTGQELIHMSRSIKEFDDAGADGFVFGVLDQSNCVDQDACADLLWITRGKPCTFHRAFDEISPDLMERELEALVELGYKAVLTSGGKRSAVEGKEKLKRLVQYAGTRIEVLIGGGVRSANVEYLMKEVGAVCFHSSAILGTTEIASDDEVRALREVLQT